jgi:tRNA-uridine 2-sulfurtransferase
MKEKVALGMSGGVDSSVAAHMLKKQGYDVTGFFIKFWSDPLCPVKKQNSCCNDESMLSAQTVAFQLGIPFYAIDAKKLFKKSVVDNFIQEFGGYRTPNPCVRCNQLVKFGWFLDFAKSIGFDKVATGHYCNIKQEKEVFKLLKGGDATKDQSYFLYRLKQEQLSRIIFPVGKYTKKEVWMIANANKIKIRNIKESQEICFIGDKDYRDFLKRYLAKNYFKSGDIVDTAGRIVGKHSGLLNYTIGQRKGIETIIKYENKKPLYVIGFDIKKNQLIVGEDRLVYKKEMVLGDLTWMSDWAKDESFKIKNLRVGIRYHHPVISCQIKKKNNNLLVTFNKPQRAITPGQSAVFYKGNTILGGGIIVS